MPAGFCLFCMTTRRSVAYIQVKCYDITYCMLRLPLFKETLMDLQKFYDGTAFDAYNYFGAHPAVHLP